MISRDAVRNEVSVACDECGVVSPPMPADKYSDATLFVYEAGYVTTWVGEEEKHLCPELCSGESKENEMAENTNEEKPKNKRGRPRAVATTNGNGAQTVASTVTAAAEKKPRGKKAAPEPIVHELYLPRKRLAYIGIPQDFDADDMGAVREQLDAMMALRAVQNKARAG